MILKSKYETYNKSLKYLRLETLEVRRKKLVLKFANNCKENPKTKDLFPLKMKQHEQMTRKSEKFHVTHANTKRLKWSAVPETQTLLNKANMEENRPS